MKKRTQDISVIVVLIGVVFFLSLWISYQLTDRNQKEMLVEVQEIQEEVASVEVSVSEEVLKKEAQIVYQYFYIQDAITKEVIEEIEPYLIGATRMQVQNIYEDWQVLLFSSNKVILRCGIEARSDEVYWLQNVEGIVQVFYENEKKELKLLERTNIYVSLLPEYEKNQLNTGFYLYGHENLIQLLADLET